MSHEVGLSDPLTYSGRVELHTIESSILKGNALGDPSTRQLGVYLPPSWDVDGASFPTIYLLPGLTGHSTKYLSTHPWKQGIVPRFDEAVRTGNTKPAILVMPDCFTSLGGSQYVNSSAVGHYEDYLVDEIVPFVDSHFPVTDGHRGVVGTSSGGFGALHLSMHHPELFSACASVSGDCCFEVCFEAEMLVALRGLVPFDGDPSKFLDAFRETHSLDGNGHAVLNVLAMSACYSPNPDSPLGFDLPMDLETGELKPEVWKRWLKFDPYRACEVHTEALKGLKLLYVEAGLADQFNLQWGLRRLVKRLEVLGVAHEHVEHEGSHGGLDHRYGPILSKLVDALVSAEN